MTVYGTATEPDKLSMLSLFRDNEERFVNLARRLGCPYEEFGPLMVSWMQNNVSGGRSNLQGLNPAFELTGDMSDDAKATLIESDWAAARDLPYGGDYPVVMWATRQGGDIVADVTIDLLYKHRASYGRIWVTANDRPLDKRDNKLNGKEIPVRDTFSPETLTTLEEHQISLTTEWSMAVATWVEKGAYLVKVDKNNTTHAVLVFADTLIYVVLVPSVNGKVANSTRCQQYLIEHYGWAFADGKTIVYVVVRMGQRPAAANAMEMAKLRPGLGTTAVWAGIAESELDDFVIKFVNEVINVMAKALQAMVNNRRKKAGLRAMDSDELRTYLDALHVREVQADMSSSIDKEFMDMVCTVA